jgi:hypothetical protein
MALMIPGMVLSFHTTRFGVPTSAKLEHIEFYLRGQLPEESGFFLREMVLLLLLRMQISGKAKEKDLR